MIWKFKNAELPCNEKEDFATSDTSVDIICRIYLAEAPSKEYEKLAMKADGENYNPDCFFIESVAGKNEPNGLILMSGWLLYYVKDNGSWVEFGYVDDDVPGALDFFKEYLHIEF